MNEVLKPVKNCWVQAVDKRQGIVVQVMEGVNGVNVKVRWLVEKTQTIEELAVLRNGFNPGMEVRHFPTRAAGLSLGEGLILRTRVLGGCDQVLVEFPKTGDTHWLPFETLAWIKGTKHRFITGDSGKEGSAERFRLKALAHAIETWNENTGSLSQLDIDPLPHQIHLVHHILASGNLNWMIADDVGLGKTIETGMLLAALKQRGQIRRILLVTPAGLTKQWQEELLHKFGMGDFQIYGEDFQINEPRHWKMYDQVIGSIDRLKHDNHLDTLLQAEPWDLIIFDEAHRLSRRQYGQKYDSSQRFQLAASLRQNADAMVLLTATPHQGMQDKFQSLLMLLHPERKDEIETLLLNPEVLEDMVFRNNKADVTDIEGNFIFKGKTTRALRVQVNEDVKQFDTTLQAYLRRGYAAGNKKGNKGHAIGFVMTIYRKLAASSAAAINTSLKRRRERLQGRYEESLRGNNMEAVEERYSGEAEETIDTQAQEFFEGEMELLDELIVESGKVLENDKKIQLFMDELIAQILASNPEEKVLIFTEYCTTQHYIETALAERFGEDKVRLINGSMKHEERREAIAHFEDAGQFLVSTEAGGEGINLQRQCHIIVNYDLPWNPMRLVQRIGRLYRYGQQIPVVVFNIHSPETADDHIIQLMYERIDQVVMAMAVVGDEFNERLQEDILGEVADLVDVGGILEQATTDGIERTQQRIDEAMERAKESAGKQRELFEYAASFDPNETRGEMVINSEHIAAFVEGMFSALAIEIMETTHKGQLWHIRMPEDMAEALGVRKTRWEVTLDRLLVASRPNTHMLDMDSFIFRHLLGVAKSYDFQGMSAVIASESLQGSAIVTGYLRWQNERGQRQRQEYTAWKVGANSQVETNPEDFATWLKQPATTGKVDTRAQPNKDLFAAIEQAANQRLSEVNNRWLHPENSEPVASAWITGDLLSLEEK